MGLGQELAQRIERYVSANSTPNGRTPAQATQSPDRGASRQAKGRGQSTVPDSYRSRGDVTGKLAGADNWIQREFDALETLCRRNAIGIQDESGPGRKFLFSNRGCFVRLHPRLTVKIVVGFPGFMRDRLASLGVLIPRRDGAWMDYDRAFDRRLVETLIEEVRTQA